MRPLSEVIADAGRSVVRQLRRSVLGVLAVAGGVGALVATVTLAESSAAHLARLFDAVSATAIDVQLPPGTGLDEPTLRRRALALTPVEEVGTFAVLEGQQVRIDAVWLQGSVPGPVVVASGYGLAAARPRVRVGALPTAAVWDLDPTLVVVGAALARELGVDPTVGRRVVQVEGIPVAVAAVVSDSDQRGFLTGSLILHPRLVERLGLGPIAPRLLVRTAPRAGPPVAEVIGAAVYPERPETVLAVLPPAPHQLAAAVGAGTRDLVTVLATATVLLGALVVGVTQLTAVHERRAEIGIRRALGASRTDVAALFLAAAGITAALGGVLGWASGTVAAAALASQRGWPLAMPTWVVGSPLLGLLAGALGGVYPAWRATRTDPVTALRNL